MENLGQDGDAATHMLDWDKNHPIGVEDLVLGLEDTLKTTTTGSKTHKKKSTIRLTIRINALCPPKVPSLQALGLV